MVARGGDGDGVLRGRRETGQDRIGLTSDALDERSFDARAVAGFGDGGDGHSGISVAQGSHGDKQDGGSVLDRHDEEVANNRIARLDGDRSRARERNGGRSRAAVVARGGDGDGVLRGRRKTGHGRVGLTDHALNDGAFDAGAVGGFGDAGDGHSGISVTQGSHGDEQDGGSVLDGHDEEVAKLGVAGEGREGDRRRLFTVRRSQRNCRCRVFRVRREPFQRELRHAAIRRDPLNLARHRASICANRRHQHINVGVARAQLRHRQAQRRRNVPDGIRHQLAQRRRRRQRDKRHFLRLYARRAAADRHDGGVFRARQQRRRVQGHADCSGFRRGRRRGVRPLVRSDGHDVNLHACVARAELVDGDAENACGCSRSRRHGRDFEREGDVRGELRQIAILKRHPVAAGRPPQRDELFLRESVGTRDDAIVDEPLRGQRVAVDDDRIARRTLARRRDGRRSRRTAAVVARHSEDHLVRRTRREPGQRGVVVAQRRAHRRTLRARPIAARSDRSDCRLRVPRAKRIDRDKERRRRVLLAHHEHLADFRVARPRRERQRRRRFAARGRRRHRRRRVFRVGRQTVKCHLHHFAVRRDPLDFARHRAPVRANRRQQHVYVGVSSPDLRGRNA